MCSIADRSRANPSNIAETLILSTAAIDHRANSVLLDVHLTTVLCKGIIHILAGANRAACNSWESPLEF